LLASLAHGLLWGVQLGYAPGLPAGATTSPAAAAAAAAGAGAAELSQPLSVHASDASLPNVQESQRSDHSNLADMCLLQPSLASDQQPLCNNDISFNLNQAAQHPNAPSAGDTLPQVTEAAAAGEHVTPGLSDPALSDQDAETAWLYLILACGVLLTSALLSQVIRSWARSGDAWSAWEMLSGTPSKRRQRSAAAAAGRGPRGGAPRGVGGAQGDPGSGLPAAQAAGGLLGFHQRKRTGHGQGGQGSRMGQFGSQGSLALMMSTGDLSLAGGDHSRPPAGPAGHGGEGGHASRTPGSLTRNSSISGSDFLLQSDSLEGLYPSGRQWRGSTPGLSTAGSLLLDSGWGASTPPRGASFSQRADQGFMLPLAPPANPPQLQPGQQRSRLQSAAQQEVGGPQLLPGPQVEERLQLAGIVMGLADAALHTLLTAWMALHAIDCMRGMPWAQSCSAAGGDGYLVAGGTNAVMRARMAMSLLLHMAAPGALSLTGLLMLLLKSQVGEVRLTATLVCAARSKRWRVPVTVLVQP
jgi:hypothetical protein